MAVFLETAQQKLGRLLRKIQNKTDISDSSQTSDIVILAEATAVELQKVHTAAAQTLDNIDVDSLVGANLDNRAISDRIPNGQGSFGRKPAVQSSGVVKIFDELNSKVTIKLYAGKPAPFAGTTTLFIEDGSALPTTGSIYIGRNTLDRFEGPIPYSAVVDNGSFWTLTLTTALSKNHLHADLIVLSQGGDRTVEVGTIVTTEGSVESPTVSFRIGASAVILDGEDSVTVPVSCLVSGEPGNVLVGEINKVPSPSFTGMAVTNELPLSNGQNIESDESLRKRIKNRPNTLSRGLNAAIEGALLGSIDEQTGKSIQSISIIDPVEPGDFSRAIVDDGGGLEPSFKAIPSDVLTDNATGESLAFKLSNSPVTEIVAIGTKAGPYVLEAGMTFSYTLDKVSEVISINPANYENLSAATVDEIARDINDQSNYLSARTIDNGKFLVLSDASDNSERLEIEPSKIQSLLGLPTSIIQPVFLYLDSKKLSYKGSTATIFSNPRNEWNVAEPDLADLRITVSGVTQEFSITDADFVQFLTSVATAPASQYAQVLNTKMAGVEFVSVGQRLAIVSLKENDATGDIQIETTKADGSPVGWIGSDKIWLDEQSGGELYDTGSQKDFKFNRATGELELLEKPEKGARLETGTRRTRAFIESEETSSGLFDLASTPTTGHPRLILGFDGDFAIRKITAPAGSEATVGKIADNTFRLTTNDPGLFAQASLYDWFYLVNDTTKTGSVPEGMYRIMGFGGSTISTDVTYNGLLAATVRRTSVTVATTLGSNIVRVSLADHGFKTGDLIAPNTVNTIGGIPPADLSFAAKPIYVTSASTFEYEADSAATSSAVGVLSSLGTNIIEVTQTSHGLNEGALIDVVSATFGGIPAVDLSVTGAEIEFIDLNTYRYRAASCCSFAVVNQSITSVTKKADSWIEFEVSPQTQAGWDVLDGNTFEYNTEMFSVFKSSVIPEVVEFWDGVNAVGSISADAVVEFINANCFGGTATKLTPKKIEVRSNKFASDSTAAVLGTVGNAGVLFSPVTAQGQQSHTAFNIAKVTSGDFPATTTVPTGQAVDGRATTTYLKTRDNYTDLLLKSGEDITIANPLDTSYPEGFQNLWVTGKNAGLRLRVYNNETVTPYNGIASIEESIEPVDLTDHVQSTPSTATDRYSNLQIRVSDLAISKDDTLVVVMDADPTDKTVVIPAGKVAKIQNMDALSGDGKGQVISLRLQDPEDGDKPFFDLDSIYKDFSFRDFKILTKSVGIYRDVLGPNVLVVRSADFGGLSKLRFTLNYPTLPDQDELQVSHSNTYGSVNESVLAVTLCSKSIINGTEMLSGTFSIKSVPNGDLFDWTLTSAALNQTSAYQAGLIMNITGSAPFSGSYLVKDAGKIEFLNATVDTTATSATVKVTSAAHGLQDGYIINVIQSTDIGGIIANDLTVQNAVITVLNANEFTYEASAVAVTTASGTLDTIQSGFVTVTAPSDGGVPATTLLDASQTQIRAWELDDKTYQDVQDAVAEYLPDSPVASIEALGPDITTENITQATYLSNTKSPAFTGPSASAALTYHAFSSKNSGEAGIFQYDSSDPSVNGIKATVQTDDSIFPTATDAAGTAYQTVGEEVYLVPTDTKTLQRWLAFRASSSLNIIADADRINSDTQLQLSSKLDGSAGAVQISGVSMNDINTPMLGNSSIVGAASRSKGLAAEIKALTKGQMVEIKNAVPAEILRAYRNTPTGSSITAANSTTTTTYFRPTNSVRYVRIDSNTGRLIFQRNGMGPFQTEPLAASEVINVTYLGNGLSRIESTTGNLEARVGDMMYVSPASNFSTGLRCQELPSSGFTAPDRPRYLGHPVVHVENSQSIICITPNVTANESVTLASGKEVVFLPAIDNSINLLTNTKAGNLFYENKGLGDETYALVKTLGNGFVSVWIQNSNSAATDDIKLGEMAVSTDDYAVFGSDFLPANQGKYRIVAHNGKNQVVIYNPNGGQDEILDLNEPKGWHDQKWRVGPMENTEEPPLRVIHADSVQIGDLIRISSPTDTNSQWFNDVFFGSWSIKGIGYIGRDFSAAALPYNENSGAVDPENICPYVDFEMKDAPVAIFDQASAQVDQFLIGANASALGFVEGTPFNVFRKVKGHAINPQNPENRDVFFEPNLSFHKMSNTFGTTIASVGKIGLSEDGSQGIDGYKTYSGLIQLAHNIIDGQPGNTSEFSGYKAGGTFFRANSPIFKNIKLFLKVFVKEGISIDAITPIIQSRVSSYVNALGPGNSLHYSNIIGLVNNIEGVGSCELENSLPQLEEGRIVVGDNVRLNIRSSSDDVVVG